MYATVVDVQHLRGCTDLALNLGARDRADLTRGVPEADPRDILVLREATARDRHVTAAVDGTLHNRHVRDSEVDRNVWQIAAAKNKNDPLYLYCIYDI